MIPSATKAELIMSGSGMKIVIFVKPYCVVSANVLLLVSVGDVRLCLWVCLCFLEAFFSL